MFENLSFFPESASTVSGRVDAVYLFLVGVSVFFVGLIVTALVLMVLRYRRREGRSAEQVAGSVPLEIAWSAVPLAIALFAFGWGAKLYVHVRTPPAGGMQFLVTGKQWMWKVQHPSGQREINALHVPVGLPIVLTMTSEDVIHDFYVPSFRVKADVVPGMYTQLWFEASKVGRYHLFCAEYCGTKHSEMVGEVVVMDPLEYEQWLTGQPAARNPVEAGKVLFENLRCDTCHASGSTERGPNLAGKFGTQVALADGQTVLFDESYVRQSILEPSRHVVAGYQPLMPTYQGQVSEEQILHLIAYLQSMSDVKPESAQR